MSLPVQSLSERPQQTQAALLCVVLAVGIAGCKVGPEYHRPSAFGTNAVPPTFAEATFSSTNAGANWAPASPSAHLPRGSWWEMFQDPELNRLETLADTGNQELVAAAARLDQARAFVRIARSDLFPQVSLNPGYTRQRTSANQPLNGRASGSSFTFSSTTVPLEARWELDLWGRVRRQTEAARARFAASADDFQAARLLIQAEVAVDYFAWRSLQAEWNLLRRSTETFQRSLELTRNRRVGGIATDLDVAQAEAQLRGTEAEIPGVELRQKQLQNALAVLCGQPATTFQIPGAAAAPVSVPTVPAFLPSQLLERRPDIAAAERRMAAANAEVGVAQTAFFPRLRLSGLAGFQSVSASSLFDWPSRLWAVGPSLELPLFTGGRNRADLAAARARYEEAVAVYRQSVLAAFQEAEDQLAAGRLLATQLEAQTAALTAAQRTLEIANNRYRAGLVTYLEVAVAQSAALERERAVVQLQAQRLAAGAGLIRVLGGGWGG